MQTQSTETNESERELIALEEEYWAAMKDADLETALRLTAFPCVVSGPQGVRAVDQATYEKMMKQMPYSLDDYELRDVSVQFAARDVAIVSYLIRSELTVDGAKLVLDCADTSTWVRTDGAWKCVQHSEAVLGDPFGRDRQAPPSVH